MATRPLGGRKFKTNVQKSSGKSDCPFGVNRSPISAQERDVAEFDDCRHRSVIERMKDAFRTISFRSEPTIGEEDLKKCYDAQTSVDGQAISRTGYPVVEKKQQEMIQNLVPHCYEHIQNFHHYRSDMERLSSGCKVLYLSANDGIGKRERVFRRVYGQNSARTDQCGPPARRYGLGKPRHFQMPRKPKTTMVTMVPKKRFTPSQKVTTKRNRNPNKNDQPQDWKQKMGCSRALSSEKDFKSCSSNSTELNVDSAGKRLSFQVEESVIGSDEMPSFKLEQTTSDDQTADIQRSRHSLGSDTFPKPPVTTPNDDMSRGSSVRTLLFESREELVKKNRNSASPRNITNKDSNHSPHYLAPFHSRFPHLKQSLEASSSNQMRQKRIADNGMIPPWQQYRILCDAFRPTMSPERFSRQNGYRKPKYATATELEYYIDIVSETNSNSSMYMS